MATEVPEAEELKTDDKRLDRLLDYTKFHIGIYLSIGGGLLAILGSKDVEYVRSLIGSPRVLLAGLIFMAIAGLAGGVIASSCTSYRTFHRFWNFPQAPRPLGCLFWFKGRTWTIIEHWSFWIGLVLIVCAVLCSRSARTWLNI